MTISTETNPADYVIPAPVRIGWIALLWPGYLFLAAILGVGLLTTFHLALNLGSVAVFAVVPVFFINAFVMIGRASARQRAIWEKHNYKWYRSRFPSHAFDKGRVSCRHCENDKIIVRNLMNRSFMRAHACSQCGSTLYFTPEN